MCLVAASTTERASILNGELRALENVTRRERLLRPAADSFEKMSRKIEQTKKLKLIEINRN